jgi:hypothetical protein
MSESTDKDEDSVDEGEGGSDRRGDPRHLACFPAHVEVGDNGVARTALIRDLSVSGALLLTRAKVKVGDVVKLSLYLKEGLDPVLVSSRVVREERRSGELVHPWTKAVAVQFETAMPEVEAEAKALADRQAALNGPPRRGSSPPPAGKSESVK